jgi:hypothetical protein
MSLSDEHRRALDEIERALEQDDPTFVATVNHDRLLQLRRRWIIIPAFLLGAVIMVAGLVATHELLVVGVVSSILGFVMMPAAVALLLRQLRDF